MNILAIDTTTKKANVGVKTQDFVKVKSIDNEVTHSEKLLPLIDETLKECNLTIKDIDCIACTTGPGSFTGIRIGLATAKALAKVTEVKIYAIDSLTLLAHSAGNSQSNKLVVSLIDAKNNRAYAGMYINGSPFAITAENKYLNEIFDDISKTCYDNNICENEVLIIADTLNIFECIPNIYKKLHTALNIEKLLSLASNTNTSTLTDYLKLDATYVRSSEAERTKYGE